MAVRSGLVRQQDRAAGAKVEIVGVEFLLIEGREEIADSETSIGQSHFEDGVAIVTAGRPECGEFPVAGDQEHVAFLVGGTDKAPVLKAVLEEKVPGEQYPAKLVQPTDGKLIWFLDRAAASGLSQQK